MNLKDRAVIQISAKVLADAERLAAYGGDLTNADVKRKYPRLDAYQWASMRSKALNILTEAAKQGLSSDVPYKVIDDNADGIGVWAMSITGKCQPFHIPYLNEATPCET